MFWLHSREECQFSLHVYSSELTWFVCNNFLHCYYTYMYLQELVQGYTVGFWFFSYAYALNFINHCFGSLFWQLGVPIGSLFHKKLGPYWVPISKLGGPYKFMWQWKRQKGPYMDPVPIIGTLWVTVAMLSGAGHCRANVVIFLQEVCYAGSILYIPGPGAGVNIFFSGWHQ